MDVNGISAFLAVAETGGVGRAANRLRRSQPAISRRIKLLEDELGAPLFERTRGGAALTEAGEAFLPFAEAALAAMRDGAAAVRELRRADRGVVSLALVGTLAETTLVAQLRRFVRRHRNVRLELRTANSREVSRLVRRGEAALGLRYFEDASPELLCERVSEERLVVACAADHPLAGRRLREPSALAGERWVGFPAARGERDSHGHLLQRTLLAAGLEATEIVAIDSLTAQKRLVEAGFGVALLPESAIQEELRLGALRLIHAPRLRAAAPVCVVRRRRGYLGAAAQSLLAAIRGAPVRPRSGWRSGGSR